MCLVLQFGMNSLYVMVVHKIVEVKISHILKIFYCMSDFKIVVVIMSAVKCFVKGIVGYTVESLPVYPAAVISVNNLSHKPEIFLDLVCGMAENPHKIKIQDISGIQADSVNIKFGNPETDHITDIVLYFRIALIQLYKKIVSTPVFIGKTVIIFGISAEIYITVPVNVRGMLTVFLDILKSEEITACMVEYTIKDHTDAFFMAGFYKIGEIFIGSETGIQFFVIGCLVAMSDTFKKRPYI